MQHVTDQAEHLNSLSPANWWPIRKNQPVPWNVPMLLLWREARRLAQMAAICRIRPQSVAECYNCNGHYNRTPDLGKCGMWWNAWDLAKHTILDTKVLDRNVTWLTRHKDTSWYEHKVRRHLTLLVSNEHLTRPLGKRMIEDELEESSDWRRPRWRSLVFELVLKYRYALGLNRSSNRK